MAEVDRTDPITATVEAEASPGVLARLSQWVRDHDESKLFILPYIALALVLTIAVSLFWLAALVALHFGFECYKQYRIGPADPAGVVARATWEVLLDLGLVFFALSLALYIDLIFGILGLGAAARAGVQGAARLGSRLAAWEGVIHGVVLSVDDVALLSRTYRGKKKGMPVAEAPPAERWGGWTRKWSLGGKICFGFAAVSLALLLLSPVLSTHDLPQILAILRAELTPIP